MRDVLEVLRQKERELALTRHIVACLRVIIPLLQEDSDKPAVVSEGESPIFNPVGHPLR